MKRAVRRPLRDRRHDSRGGRVACRITLSATHDGEFQGSPPTGRRLRMDHVHWHRLADGKVVERWAVRDDLGAAQQLGLLPS